MRLVAILQALTSERWVEQSKQRVSVSLAGRPLLQRGCPRPWKHGFVLSRKRLARGFPCSSSAARGSGTADLLQPRLAVTPLLLSFPPPCSSSSSGTETGDTPRPPLPPSQAEARLRVEVSRSL